MKHAEAKTILGKRRACYAGGGAMLLLILLHGGDPDLDAVKSGLAPANAYLDTLGSWSSNEYAIDYNAPVVMLTAYFVSIAK